MCASPHSKGAPPAWDRHNACYDARSWAPWIPNDGIVGNFLYVSKQSHNFSSHPVECSLRLQIVSLCDVKKSSWVIATMHNFKGAAETKQCNFDSLHRNPSETMTNYLIRRQRIYFKAFQSGGGYDPVALPFWNAVAMGKTATTANNGQQQLWKQADETRKLFECWQWLAWYQKRPYFTQRAQPLFFCQSTSANALTAETTRHFIASICQSEVHFQDIALLRVFTSSKYQTLWVKRFAKWNPLL